MNGKHTPTPWQMVSDTRYDSGLTYVSLQPVTPAPETMRPLLMASGEYHVCRMSHTAARHAIAMHEANAAFIVLAVNSHDALVEALRATVAEIGDWARPTGANGMTSARNDHPLIIAAEQARAALAKAGAP